jgi:hypothetical protein
MTGNFIRVAIQKIFGLNPDDIAILDPIVSPKGVPSPEFIKSVLGTDKGPRIHLVLDEDTTILRNLGETTGVGGGIIKIYINGSPHLFVFSQLEIGSLNHSDETEKRDLIYTSIHLAAVLVQRFQAHCPVAEYWFVI